MQELPLDERKPPAPVNDGTWEEDQKEREYYYDDAHGYEVYEPEAEPDDEDDATS